ncbi:MAG: SANT/Myb-like DNA-binding domain-containing protein [Candidatus Bathyarchaeia archaeon]|jgi:hypothetical protein
MFLKPLLCVNCGEPKKTKVGTLCQKCSSSINAKVWTPEEESLLKSMYQTYTVPEIAKKLPKHSVGSVATKAHMLKLHKSKQTVWCNEDAELMKEMYGCRARADAIYNELRGRHKRWSFAKQASILGLAKPLEATVK